MAHLHFRRTVYKAGAAKASERLEYITGHKITEQDKAARQLHYISQGREDLVHEETRNLPPWAQGNPHTYFRAAEQYERSSPGDEQRRGIAFEEWKITLPHEFSRDQNLALARRLIATIAGETLPCTYAFHSPPTVAGTREQPHLHLLISARMNDGHARTPAQHFSRWNSKHPERGGAQKSPAFWHKGAIKAHRVMIADILNLHLERAGLVQRVHPDTLESRGINREPEPKLLPSESREYREKGIVSEAMGQVLKIREARSTQEVRESLNARAYWESRKADLGLLRDMDMPAQLAVIVAARMQRVQQGPAREVVEGYVGVEIDDRLLGDVGQEPSLTHALATLTQRLDTLEERGRGEHLRVRLWEEQGMSR